MWLFFVRCSRAFSLRFWQYTSSAPAEKTKRSILSGVMDGTSVCKKHDLDIIAAVSCGIIAVAIMW